MPHSLQCSHIYTTADRNLVTDNTIGVATYWAKTIHVSIDTTRTLINLIFKLIIITRKQNFKIQSFKVKKLYGIICDSNPLEFESQSIEFQLYRNKKLKNVLLEINIK